MVKNDRFTFKLDVEERQRLRQTAGGMEIGRAGNLLISSSGGVHFPVGVLITPKHPSHTHTSNNTHHGQ